MNPVRIIYQDTPDAIPVPEQFRHGRSEIIIWPLESEATTGDQTEGKGRRRRAPPPALAGKVRELGDVMSTVPPSDWGIDS